MYINNTTKKPIKDITFDGFVFTLPPGVMLVWDKFGEFLINKIYSSDGGITLPPVIVATADQWKGVLYADVRRFEINAELIPNRADLLKLAKQRGIDAETLEQWKEDDTIENAEMARLINELAVPDYVKYPEATESTVSSVSADAADEALKGEEKPEVVNAPAPKVVEPKAPAATTAAPKTPKTPKPAKTAKAAKK